jgi:hypothetical protein
MPTKKIPVPKKVHPRVAYHRRIEAEERAPAEYLVGYLMQRFAPTTVADFGCSTGTYVRPWPSAVHVWGFESDPLAVEHKIDGRVLLHDLTRPISQLRNMGWVDLGICLEVLEHIPERDAETVIENITDGVKQWLIFSAAIPGQGGDGHINCKDKPYWIRLLEHRGFIVDYVETVALLEALRRGPHMGWLTQNGMVLRRFP